MKVSSTDIEDWEVYEESMNKPNEKRNAKTTKNIEVNYVCTLCPFDLQTKSFCQTCLASPDGNIKD